MRLSIWSQIRCSRRPRCRGCSIATPQPMAFPGLQLTAGGAPCPTRAGRRGTPRARSSPSTTTSTCRPRSSRRRSRRTTPCRRRATNGAPPTPSSTSTSPATGSSSSAAAAATGHAPAESFHEFVRDADLTKHRYLPLDSARMRRLLETRLPPVRGGGGGRRCRGRGRGAAAAAAAAGGMAKVKEESGSGSESGAESESEPEPEPRRREHSQSQVMTQVAAARASIVKHLEAAPATLAELAVWCKRALALTAPPPRDALLDLVHAWPEVLELNVPATAPLRPLGVITLAPESAAATAAAAAAPPRAAQAAAAMDACVVLCAAPDFASKIPAKAVAEPRPPEMDFEDIDEDDIAQLYEQWGQLGEEDPG
eukprot:TRINITY_DN5475_c0_g1_i1.p2 TRINITY_DN5475_c0_g1~~TRINITY_DN5475_c0_g1_i1.p2  ORF type:complete len:368 (-),score=78.95 TRINITY_DN5475_c0_g1_i1:587-1690(-)